MPNGLTSVRKDFTAVDLLVRSRSVPDGAAVAPRVREARRAAGGALPFGLGGNLFAGPLGVEVGLDQRHTQCAENWGAI